MTQAAAEGPEGLVARETAAVRRNMQAAVLVAGGENVQDFAQQYHLAALTAIASLKRIFVDGAKTAGQDDAAVAAITKKYGIRTQI